MKGNIDWHKEPQTLSIKIDSSYKNTRNVRRFFLKEIGEHFHFNRLFMKYLKENIGITLKQAETEWKKKNEG